MPENVAPALKPSGEVTVPDSIVSILIFTTYKYNIISVFRATIESGGDFYL
jgi:hypothetical protein